jgi:HPt (histidine-containing phosphotransfer) domain-containing protein
MPIHEPHPSAAQAQAPDTVTLAPQALQTLRSLSPGHEGEFMRRVLRTYRQSLDRYLADIERGLVSGDLAVVRLSAHSLKSSSAQVGAVAFSDRCAALEFAAAGRPQDPGVALADLVAAVLTAAPAVARAVESAAARESAP